MGARGEYPAPARGEHDASLARRGVSGAKDAHSFCCATFSAGLDSFLKSASPSQPRATHAHRPLGYFCDMPSAKSQGPAAADPRAFELAPVLSLASLPPNSARALAREFGFAPNSAPGSRRSLPSIFFSLFWRSWRSTNNFFERPVPDSTGTGRGFLETYFLVEFFAQTVVELR